MLVRFWCIHHNIKLFLNFIISTLFWSPAFTWVQFCRRRVNYLSITLPWISPHCQFPNKPPLLQLSQQIAPPPLPLPLIFMKWGYHKQHFFFITFLWLRVEMLCEPSFRNYQMHIVCSYSVVQFLFQSLDTGEKNLPIYDLVLQLMAGREGWGGGQGKRARTPGSATELKKSIINLFRFNCQLFLSQKREI